MKVYEGIGPLKIAVNGSQKKVILNPDSTITKHYHLLVIDFPCGIGFLNSTGSFQCPEYPNQNSKGEITFDDLAATLADGLKDFFSTKLPECYLHNMQALKIFLWSQGLGAQLAIALKKQIDVKMGGSLKVKGIILGDAIVDLKRQSQNFASFGVGRSVISRDTYRELIKMESVLLLQDLDNEVYCNMLRNVTMKFDPLVTCPYDLKSTCPSLQQFIGSTTNCDLFVIDQIESDPDNPLLKILQDKMKIISYKANPSALLWPQTGPSGKIPKLILYNPKAIDEFIEVLNDIPILMYQSQNNFMSNTISSMLFADPLRWKDYDQFTSSNTQFINNIDKSNPKMKYTLRSYGNLNRAQLFDIGGLYNYRSHSRLLRDFIFKDFTSKIK